MAYIDLPGCPSFTDSEVKRKVVSSAILLLVVIVLQVDLKEEMYFVCKKTKVVRLTMLLASTDVADHKSKNQKILASIFMRELRTPPQNLYSTNANSDLHLLGKF